MRATRKPLATVEIPAQYIRHGETRTVSPYQANSMRSLDYPFELGTRRILIETPGGTTDLTGLYLKRLLQRAWIEKVLFLVDRDPLAMQALEAIQDIVPAYPSYWLRPGSARQEQQITVALLQAGNYIKRPSPPRQPRNVRSQLSCHSPTLSESLQAEYYLRVNIGLRSKTPRSDLAL